MSCYNNISSKKAKACIGSMDSRIEIQTRAVVYYSGYSQYSFTTTNTVWANVETRNGIAKFNDINVDNAFTHIFIIRKISTLTSEYWVNYNSERYRIIAVETVNNGSFQKVYCKLTGDDDLDGSKS